MFVLGVKFKKGKKLIFYLAFLLPEVKAQQQNAASQCLQLARVS
jgi:hypothetical protein